MVKYCTNCGHVLQEEEKFCSECGTAAGGVSAPAAKSVQYEYCETHFEEVYYFGLYRGRFFVKATGPYGTKTILQSKVCKGDAYQEGLNIFTGPSRKSEGVLNELMRTLSSDGWELLSSGGRFWWNHKFRRPVKG